MKNSLIFFNKKNNAVLYTEHPLFDDSFRAKDPFYKIYHDGSHFVATQLHEKKKTTRFCNPKTDIDFMFDVYYAEATQKGLTKKQTINFVYEVLKLHFPEADDLFEYVQKKVKVALHNLFVRLKRFKRKAMFNMWNYFVTITYDDKKMDEVNFRFKLRKTLSNFACRRRWRYMGVFERAPETNRLHFHALMYIPQNQMVGEIIKIRDYSTKQGKMQESFQNTFFNKKFGRSDFAAISFVDVKFGNAISYITKYIAKSGEKIIYSRGIPSEIIKRLYPNDFACVYYDFVTKFILFDDVIESPGFGLGYQLTS